MSAPDARRSRRLSAVLLWLAALIFVAGLALSWRTTNELEDSIEAASDAQQVLEQVNRLWGVLGDRDLQLLRYLLRGRDEFLAEYGRMLDEMQEALARLRTLVRDNPQQLAALDEITTLYEVRVARAAEVIALKQAALRDEPGAQERLDDVIEDIRGPGNAGAMRVLLERMADSEKARIAERSQQRQRMLERNRSLVRLATGVAALAGAVALLALGWVWRREREALQAQIQAQQARRRQQDLERLAHDLRNHFGNILFASTLVRESGGPAAALPPLGSLEASAQSGLAFLDATLAQAADEAEGRDRGPAVLAPVLETAVASLAAQAQVRGMRVQVAAEPGLAVRAGPQAAQRLVLNLLSNALKYGPAGGSVEIVARRQGGMVRLQVLDRGPGVSAADQGRLFQRFTPLSARPEAGEPSAGLGLALARQTARALGGDLGYSDRAGGGACFELDLPIAG